MYFAFLSSRDSRNGIASSIVREVKSAIFKSLILHVSTFSLSLRQWQTGQSLEVTTRSTYFKKRFFSKLSFSRKDLLKRWINPSYFAVLGQFSGGFLSFFGFVYKKMSISSSV